MKNVKDIIISILLCLCIVMSGATFLRVKVIQGELDLTFDVSNQDGYINKSNDFTLGYLKQISFSNENLTLEETMLECYKDILALEDKLRKLEENLQNDTSEKTINDYSKTHEMFENLGGYYYQKEYNTVLKKFGFEQDKIFARYPFSYGSFLSRGLIYARSAKCA